MLTLDQLLEYFASLGIQLPESTVQCIVDIVNSKYDCMVENGYSDCYITLALQLAASLIAISMGARMVASHSAGKVSQSYKYPTLDQIQTTAENNLNIYDPAGCTDDIIPAKNVSGFIFASKGCKC